MCSLRPVEVEYDACRTGGGAAGMIVALLFIIGVVSLPIFPSTSLSLLWLSCHGHGQNPKTNKELQKRIQSAVVQWNIAHGPRCCVCLRPSIFYFFAGFGFVLPFPSRIIHCFASNLPTKSKSIVCIKRS